MITDYLKAGFPAILLQTQEPHRADELMRKIPEWQICRWDCVSGVHGMAPSSFTLNEIPPVEAVPWLSTVKDTVFIALGLQHFLDDPVVFQSFLNGILLWQSVGNCPGMVSPSAALPIQLHPFFISSR